MSQNLIMIATAVVALTVGRLTAWPTIRRLRTAYADAARRLAHDPLTGMFNRVGFYAAHAAIVGGLQPVVILLIDLDGFKPVNDTHGHDIGDRVLVEIGDRIGEAAEVYDGVAARLSGDEFAVMAPIRDHDPCRIADLFGAVIGRPIALTAGDRAVELAVTASIGAAVVETTDPLDDVALRRADIAMFHAKSQGRNRYAIYQPGMAMPTGAPHRGPRLRDMRHRQRGVTA